MTPKDILSNIRPTSLSSFFLYSYFKGLDNLIATARSNKVAVCLGFQDFSQLERDYGKPEAAVAMNTVGNIFSGQVVGSTAKTLSGGSRKLPWQRLPKDDTHSAAI